VAIQSLFFSQANAPFLVERHSGDEFDKLEPDSNLFTKLIEEYTPSSYKYTPSSYKVPWIVIDNSSGSCSTLVAKGRGRQAFFNLFGIQDNNQRLVSILEVGQRTIFNPSSPTDKPECRSTSWSSRIWTYSKTIFAIVTTNLCFQPKALENTMWLFL